MWEKLCGLLRDGVTTDSGSDFSVWSLSCRSLGKLLNLVGPTLHLEMIMNLLVTFWEY